MKKFLGVLFLIAGFVLVSCGTKDLSYGDGDVSFSISGSEVGRYLAARNTDGSADDKIEFAILAQVKGSKGYHAWERRMAYYIPATESVVMEGGTGAANGHHTESGLPDEVKENIETLNIPFSHLPVNQTYTVEVDVFKKGPGSAADALSFSDAWSVSLSGEETDIKLSARSSTPVTVDLYDANADQNNFAYKVSYVKDNQTQTEFISLDYENLQKYKFSKDDENVYFAYGGREWHTLTEFKLVIDSNSHFSKGATFRFVEKVSSTATTGEGGQEKKVIAEASNGEIDLLSMVLVKESGSDDGLFKTIELDFEGIALYQYMSHYISPEKENFGSFSSYEHNYKFIKDTEASDEAKNRFVMTIPLVDIFGEEPLAKGDSIAFLLNSLEVNNPDKNESVSTNNLAYQLQKDGWDTDNPTKRYANNTTIDIQSLSDSLVLATNFIDGDEKYLQIYIDLEKNYNTVNELDASFTMNYKVFPASDKVYIFYTNYDTYSEPPAYRFDMNIKLNSYLKATGRKPKQNSTVTVPVGGTFYWVSNYGKTIPEEGYIYGNFIDNAGYKENGSTTESWYHVLSKAEQSSQIGSDGAAEPFAFSDIAEPHTYQSGDKYFVDNDFGLQCYYRLNEEDSTSNLFIIENFSIGASVDGEFTIWDVN